jgi:hypothetical protein
MQEWDWTCVQVSDAMGLREVGGSALALALTLVSVLGAGCGWRREGFSVIDT